MPAAVIKELHLHIHSYPRFADCIPPMKLYVQPSADAPRLRSRRRIRTAFTIGDFRKALAFAVAINKKGGFKWEK